MALKRGDLPSDVDRAFDEELLEREQFRMLAESLVSAVFVVLDVDVTRIEYASPGITALLRRSAMHHGHGQRGLLAAIHPDDRERARSEGEQCRSGPRDFDMRLHDAEGRLRWLRCRGFPIRDGAGVVRRLGFLFEDRTAQRQAQALLDDLQRHAANLARAAADPFGLLRRALDGEPAAVEPPSDRRRAPLAAAPGREGFAQRSALLTRREREVMELLVRGSSTRQIAEQLGLSRKTIECHRTQVMRKMRTQNVAALVRLALLGRRARGRSVT
jgi:DNA-binding CsgD family transcriptional regulator